MNIYLGNDNNVVIGDINNDGGINIIDVVQLVNIILLGYEITIESDINQDNQLNILDIVQLVSLILNI